MSYADTSSVYPWAGEFVDPDFIPESWAELAEWQEKADERRGRINMLAAWLLVDMLPHHKVIAADSQIRDAETGLTDEERRASLLAAIHSDTFAEQFQHASASGNNQAVWDYLVNFFETHPMTGEYCRVNFPAPIQSTEEPIV